MDNTDPTDPTVTEFYDNHGNAIARVVTYFDANGLMTHGFQYRPNVNGTNWLTLAVVDRHQYTTNGR